MIESSRERVVLELASGRYRVELDPGARRSYRLEGDDIGYSVSGAMRRGGLPIDEPLLVNLSGEISRETYTDHHGSYLFSNLPPGEYRVRIQGSVNTQRINIKDHSLCGINFN